MNHQVTLTITSLLSILFTIFHLTDDIVHGMSPSFVHIAKVRDVRGTRQGPSEFSHTVNT